MFKMTTPDLGQFQGCLAGVLVGDCLGYPYEVIRWKHCFPRTFEFIQDDFEKMKTGNLIPYYRTMKTKKAAEAPTDAASNYKRSSLNVQVGKLGKVSKSSVVKEINQLRQYTDDTSMTISVAKFLTDCDGENFDYVNLAKRFCAKLKRDIPMKRGYGGSAKAVMGKLEDFGFKDLYKPASQQFKGQGSLGNGTGMRISPVALFTIKDPTLERLLEFTINSSRITHAHPEGIVGGIFQALAVRQALLFGAVDKSSARSSTIDVDILDAFETEFKSLLTDSALSQKINDYRSGFTIYLEKLVSLRKLLLKGPLAWNVAAIKKELGNKCRGPYSIPTALFCFLAGFKEIPHIAFDNHMERTLTLVMAVGGDTDTIGSMSGAICGAYLGLEGIHENILKSCEASQELLNLGAELFQKLPVA